MGKQKYVALQKNLPKYGHKASIWGGGGILKLAPFLGMCFFLAASGSAVFASGHEAKGDCQKAEESAPLIVVIDAGHGGREHGCTGVSGAKEKDVVLKISMHIRDLLKELPDVHVIMTREKDTHVPLWDRVDMANDAHADLFISVHANAFVRRKMHGVETFFHSVDASDEEARRVASAENAQDRGERSEKPDQVMSILADMQRTETLRESSRFAHLVQAKLAKALPFENLGVKQADFVVLRGTKMPSVLLEVGFLTNPREDKILRKKSTHENIAQAVRMAVLEYKHLMQKKMVTSSPGVNP